MLKKTFLLIILISLCKLSFAVTNDELSSFSSESWEKRKNNDEMRDINYTNYMVFSKAEQDSEKIGLILDFSKHNILVSFMPVGGKMFSSECFSGCNLDVKFDNFPVLSYNFKAKSFNLIVQVPKKVKGKFSNEFIKKILKR